MHPGDQQFETWVITRLMYSLGRVSAWNHHEQILIVRAHNSSFLPLDSVIPIKSPSFVRLFCVCVTPIQPWPLHHGEWALNELGKYAHRTYRLHNDKRKTITWTVTHTCIVDVKVMTMCGSSYQWHIMLAQKQKKIPIGTWIINLNVHL